MQSVWKKVHCQGKRPMIRDDFSFNDFSCWEDPGLSLRNGRLIRQLRTVENSIQEKLTELEKDPVPNKELILQERAILEATQKELYRLERKTLETELAIN
jgi:hypothetical protein